MPYRHGYRNITVQNLGSCNCFLDIVIVTGELFVDVPLPLECAELNAVMIVSTTPDVILAVTSEIECPERYDAVDVVGDEDGVVNAE